MNRKVCDFFSRPGGCKNGDTCRFAHTTPNGSNTLNDYPTSLSSADAAAIYRPRFGDSTHQHQQCPGGACRTYWQHGHCKFDLKCQYRHEHNPNRLRATQGQSSSAQQSSKTWRQLQTHNSSGSTAVKEGFPTYDTIQSPASDNLLVPDKMLLVSEVMTILKVASKGDASMDSGLLVETLVRALCASNKNNKGWTYEERQSLFDMVAQPPGELLLRIGEILRWADVTTTEVNSTLSYRKRISFQSCYMGIIAYLTSESVIKSPAHTNLRALYGLINANLESILDTIRSSIDACLRQCTFRGKSKVSSTRIKVVDVVSGLQIFKPIAVLLIGYVSHYRSSTTSHPELVEFVSHFEEHFRAWKNALLQGNFDDSLAGRSLTDKKYFLGKIETEMETLVKALEHSLPLSQRKEIRAVSSFAPSMGVLAYLDREYVGPGQTRPEGPRHDNDHADIKDISIPPTAEELIATAEPYLPVNLVGAKHHLAADSVDKIIDIQFRSLRADATTSLIKGVQVALQDLNQPAFDITQMARVIRNGGGRYVASVDQSNSILLPLISNIQFTGVALEHKHGLVVQVRGDAPPGPARTKSKDAARRYWEGGKRLPMGGLVAIITKEFGETARACLATLTAWPGNITTHFQDDQVNQINFGLSFVDHEEGLKAVQVLKRKGARSSDIRVLLESPVLYEAVRPFLEAIQQIDPVTLPLAEYIRHGSLENRAIGLPEYARRPDFTWNLKTLLDPAQEEVVECIMDPANPSSVEAARQVLHAHGKLDKSQNDAVLDALTREIALMQGPPGTGKTFTGVELLRLLIENNTGPIVLIAFTNHALDNILGAILEKDVTKDLLRIGTKSKNELVAGYSLETVRQVGRIDTSLHHEASKYHREMVDLEKDMEKVSQSIISQTVNDQEILQYMLEGDRFLELVLGIKERPDWVESLFEYHVSASGWTTVRKRGKETPEISPWSFWVQGMDLDHLRGLEHQASRQKHAPMPVPAVNNRFIELQEDLQTAQAVSEDGYVTASEDGEDDIDDSGSDDFMFEQPAVMTSMEDSDEESGSSTHATSIESTPTPPSKPKKPTVEEMMVIMQDKDAFLEHFQRRLVPKVPTTIRPLEVLLRDGDVWTFSAEERGRVAAYISSMAKKEIDEDVLRKFEILQKQHQEARKRYAEKQDMIRVRLLQDVKLVGATTTGAAKNPGVLNSFSPQVMVIEEAGQVLEAHVLATLFPSVKHVIAIGDPLQLRPNVNCYELSVDSARGKQLYRFDVSLMERLSDGGLPMSQLQVQRRMRPEISSLIRNTLYPRLEDHTAVQAYPDVRGMGHNLFFLDHAHRDSSAGDDGVSRYNKYEVRMACELAKYFLKQGCYNKEGDIVILCAYLGQLLKIRDELKNDFMVILDERDQRELDKRGEEGAEDLVPEAYKVAVGQQIWVRTVDNFQGEEAKVVILCLVRNAGGAEETSSAPNSIGFLKSNNRVNVALSRARHGMYIMGNSEQLASKSKMWGTIIEELSEAGNIGTGWPLVCANHPHMTRTVDKPDQMRLYSPEGGCVLPCNMAMPCGHICTQTCHSDDQAHTRIECRRPCGRLLPCGHACQSLCFQDCAPCGMIQPSVELPCGHKVDLPCAQLSRLDLVECQIPVKKNFATCEHATVVPCGHDIANYSCTAPCGQYRDCCGRTCTAQCHVCQRLSPKPTPSTAPTIAHSDAPGDDFDTGETILVVNRVSRIKHDRHKCEKALEVCGHQCSGTCEKDHTHPPCLERCLQQCEHKQCDQQCRMPCSPCREPCQWSCEYKKCNMPCAMPCDRLPCDEPCTKLLSCGHPCPSFCGEICDEQICVQCATPHQLAQEVDIFENMTMGVILKENPNTRFITLSCGHTFTAETLDGAFGLSQLHEVDQQTGKAFKIRVPEPGEFTERPRCCYCRTAVISPRYTRIVKRALLDIQEKNAIQNLAADIARQRRSIGSIDFDQMSEQVGRAMTNVSFGLDTNMPAKKRLNAIFRLRPDDEQCISPEVFTGDLKGLFKIDPNLGSTWRKITESAMKVYQHLAKMINRNALPHVMAYQEALTSIYRQEMDLAQARLMVTPESAIDQARRSDRAMRVARMRVGTPFPQGESRFKIEAIHETIQLRLHLATVAEKFAKELWVDPSSRTSTEKGRKAAVIRRDMAARQFGVLGLAILRSARRDADLAANLCRNNDSKRLGLSTEVLVIQVQFDLIRYTSQTRVERCSLVQKQVAREEESLRVIGEREKAEVRFKEAIQSFMGHNDGRTDELGRWVQDTIRPAASMLFAEWDEYAIKIKTNTGFSEVTRREREEIVKAVLAANDNYGGRFYQCPNGHSFTIDNCGQANQVALCPECRAPIGGREHVLEAGNIRDVEMDEIAVGLGARVNPHVRN